MLYLIGEKLCVIDGNGNFVGLRGPEWYRPKDAEAFRTSKVTQADIIQYCTILSEEQNLDSPDVYAQQNGLSLDDLAKTPWELFEGQLPEDMQERFKLKINTIYGYG